MVENLEINSDAKRTSSDAVPQKLKTTPKKIK